MFEIKKIESVNLDSLRLLSEYLKNYTIDVNLFRNADCNKLYMREDYIHDHHFTMSIEKCELSKLKDKKILNYVEDIIEFLKTQYDARIIWLNIFPPNTKLNFHIDDHKNRHLLSLDENERYFNYEYVVTESISDQEIMRLLNNKLDVDDLDNFNEYFLSLGNSKIINLEKNSVYTFGNTIHTFVNGSDKLRCAFVFEI